MKVIGTVVQDRAEVWFRGSRDERQVRVLTLLDMDPTDPMPNTFDYRPSDEETKRHPPGSLAMKPVTLSVRAITPAKGGRLTFAGSLQVNGAK